MVSSTDCIYGLIVVDTGGSMPVVREASRYRGLILDFVGVLTEPVAEPHRAWCLSQGLAPTAWVDALDHHLEGRALYRELEAGRLSQAEWNRRTAALLGVDEHENLMGRAWAQVRPDAGMMALARRARRADVKLGMLSNSFGLRPYDPYPALGVWELVDVAVISEREGVAKPDPAIYERVLVRMGLPASECVFVDDNPANLPPAAALGITTVHAEGDSSATCARLAELFGLPDSAWMPSA